MGSRFMVAAVAFICALGAAQIQSQALAAGQPASTTSDWKLVKSETLPQDQVSQISGNLGGKVAKITNDHYQIGDATLQANVITCQTAADAQKIQAALLKMKGNPIYCLRKEKQVVELISREPCLVIEAGYVLDFVPRQLKYRVSFWVATVDKCDYPNFNKLFNLLLEYEKAADKPAVEKRISELARNFTFGDSIVLRTPADKSPYKFGKAPVKTETLGQGDRTQYSFGDLTKVAGIPFTEVSAEIGVTAFEFRQPKTKPGQSMLDPTAFWPVEDKEVKELAARIASGAKTDAQKVKSLLDWLVPGKNIKYGEAVGTRYGVKQTLKQGFGQCWDFSDVFVSLCRASGVPCRQVGGWLYGQCGHIWAEVYIDGKGWQYVDPTAGSPCGVYHVPFFLTEDGEMPIVYVTIPKLEIAEKDQLLR